MIARRCPVWLGACYLVIWTALAIQPRYRQDWALENALTIAFVVALAATYPRWPLSDASCGAIFTFLCIHAVGAHYTYSEVPYDAWFAALTGRSLNGLVGWRRNHFDRFAHLAYGLLLLIPIREVFVRALRMRGFWSYFLPFDVVISTSSLYELVEWAAALVLAGDLGAAYLGTQGDVWDAQRDMGLAALGGLLSTAGAALLDWHRARRRAAPRRGLLAGGRRRRLAIRASARQHRDDQTYR